MDILWVSACTKFKNKNFRYGIPAYTSPFGTLQIPQVPKACSPQPPLGGRCWSAGGAQIVFMRDIFIFNEIWAQDKICILVNTFLP
jgi:hypothetical protein